MKLFRQISIWNRIDDNRAVRFNCIEELSTHKFTVQSADFFTLPIKGEHLAYFERSFPERFIDVEPEQRKWFDSIEQAIAAHQAEFR